MERTGDLGDHRGVVSFPPFFCCVHHFRAKGAFWQKGGKSQDHEFRKRRRRRRVDLRKKSFPFVFIPRPPRREFRRRSCENRGRKNSIFCGVYSRKREKSGVSSQYSAGRRSGIAPDRDTQFAAYVTNRKKVKRKGGGRNGNSISGLLFFFSRRHSRDYGIQSFPRKEEEKVSTKNLRVFVCPRFPLIPEATIQQRQHMAPENPPPQTLTRSP